MTTITVDLTAPMTLVLTLEQGTTGHLTVTLTADGEPLPLDGWDIRYEAHTPTRIIKDVDDGTITQHENAFDMEFTPEDTAGLPISGSRQFTHACRVASPAGKVYPVFKGSLILDQALIADMSPLESEGSDS
jgi:hypothetical protein